MAHEFTYTRRIEFADTDAAGVAHFAAFFRFMEEAEHAFYRSLGSSAYRVGEDSVEGMPRVSVRCDYLRPARYADELQVRLRVREMTAKAIGYDVRFEVREEGEPVTVARGEMKVVHVARAHGDRDWTVTELPAELRERIEVAPESPPEDE
jgi:acyl-CoA thioester hydrolase